MPLIKRGTKQLLSSLLACAGRRPMRAERGVVMWSEGRRQTFNFPNQKEFSFFFGAVFFICSFFFVFVSAGGQNAL
jgi:hypothetical protein